MSVYSIQVHPTNESILLLSVENTLQLLDISQSPCQMVRQYNAREIPPGVSLDCSTFSLLGLFAVRFTGSQPLPNVIIS